MKDEISQFYESESKTIPFPNVFELFQNLEYGSVLSVGCKLLHETGCRISELNTLKPNMIYDGVIYFYPGKNQGSSMRNERISEKLQNEIKRYRKYNRVPGNQILGVDHSTFRRYFTRERKRLPIEWNEKEKQMFRGEFMWLYKFPLKGFRKNFATMVFFYYWKKYGDTDLATIHTAKRMKHSSKHMTAIHYISDVDKLNCKNYLHSLPFQNYDVMAQKNLLDYCNGQIPK